MDISNRYAWYMDISNRYAWNLVSLGAAVFDLRQSIGSFARK
jgi:hypothetical protein